MTAAADVLSKAARRPAMLLGNLREIVATVVCMACYPFGIGSGGPRSLDDEPPVPQRRSREVASTPVLLVHGFGHNRSGWMFLERHLRQAGFHHVESMNYSPFSRDIGRVAINLAREVDAVRGRTGARRVHLVGHSLGGILIRYYVQLLGGDTQVDTAITVASPHEGTVAGHLVTPSIVGQLRPDSWVIRGLHETARPMPVRWIAYYSNLDVLVQPGTSAMLRHPALDATNLLVRDHGHLSMLLSPGLGRSVAQQLAVAEGLGASGWPPATDDEPDPTGETAVRSA
jgi:triacylglycerol lipase